jgi:hypothetical protein
MTHDATSEIADKVMDANERNGRIKFIGGKGISDCDDEIIFSIAHSTHSSSAVLFDVFQELIVRDFQAEKLWYTTFVGFDFEELPANIAQVLVQVKYCIFIECSNLSSLGTAVSTLSQLQVLICRFCPSLTSLSSLKTLPCTSPLNNVGLKYCGLQVTPDDGWEDGLRALGRSNAKKCILTIQNCSQLKVLPPSIKNLSKKSCTQIVLVSNPALNRLPLELGDIRGLQKLRISECCQLQHLPWTMSRIPECSITVNDNPILYRKLFLERNEANNRTSSSPEVNLSTIKVLDISAYFQSRRGRFLIGLIKLKIYLSRRRKESIHTLYKPGGVIFERSKLSFETMAMRIQNPN